jgi:bifunctional DNase/RNase
VDVKPVDVLGVRVEKPTNQPIVLLRERGGERYLPDLDRSRPRRPAIAYAQQGVEPPRPLTHDLLKDVIESSVTG